MLRYLLVFFIGICCTKAWAQPPNWDLDVTNYQFSMTLTGSLNINGATLSSTNDKVAAFVNGELRGVASVSYVNNAQKYVVFLSIYANANEEEINFKIYNSATDTVVEVDKTIIFQIDDNLGSVFQAISIAQPALQSSANFTSFSLNGVQEKSVIISENSISIVVPENTITTNLIANFTVSDRASVFIDNVLQTTGVSSQNYTSPLVFQVLSEDESTLKEYVVTVEKEVLISNLNVELSSSSFLIAQNPITITLTTTEEVIDINYEDFILENAAIQSITKNDATNYTLQLVALQDGFLTIKMPVDVIKSLQDIPNNASNILQFTYDNSKPYLVSILKKQPNTTITNANTVVFTATFNKAVQNVTPESFQTVAGGVIAVEKVTDTIYTLTVSSLVDYNGLVSVTLNPDHSIKDNFGNLLRTAIFKNY